MTEQELQQFLNVNYPKDDACEVLQMTGLVEKSGQGVDKMFYHCLMEGKRIPDFSDTDNFQVSLKIFGVIENQSFLLFVKSIQDSRKDNEKLNLFDLIALYRASKGESQRDTDGETLNKLIKEGLLVETESGYKLPKLYDEMSGTLSGTTRKYKSVFGKVKMTCIVCN